MLPFLASGRKRIKSVERSSNAELSGMEPIFFHVAPPSIENSQAPTPKPEIDVAVMAMPCDGEKSTSLTAAPNSEATVLPGLAMSLCLSQ